MLAAQRNVGEPMPLERLGRADWILKGEFHSRLRRWYEDTDENLVGDPDAHALTAWIWVRDGHRLARLNADTTRDAVGEYLSLVRSLPRGDMEWSIVPCARGNFTKVAFGPDRVVLPSFHLDADPATVPARLEQG
jgi:hypothetical protein